MKKGRFSKDEMEYMMANASSMSNDALAEKMDRDPVSVEAWVKNLRSKRPSLLERDLPPVFKIRTRTFCLPLVKNCFSVPR
jgi:hypothetical protein